jgi:MFS family permease
MTDERSPTPAAGPFHPSRRPYRFSLLFVVAMLVFGSYFAYDSIGAIESELIKKLGFGRSTVGNLYSMYSLAAIPIVFIGGMLVDKLGMRLASLLFSGMVTLGTVIVALSKRVVVMSCGRLLFGAGSESLIVAQSAILARWFRGKELALAFGLTLTVSRLGTLFSFNTEALISDYFGGYAYALWAAVFFCAFSFLCNFLFIAMDRHGERVLDLPGPSPGDKVSLGDIRAFGAPYWYVTLLCVTFYSAVFPFTSLSTDFFHEAWKIPTTIKTEGGFFVQAFSNFLNMGSTAGGITSIPIFASMCLAPFAGHLIDRVGRRATIMLAGALLIIPAHLLLGFSHVYPAYPMMLLGAAFVLVPAAMWPAVPLIVAKERLGTAYGVTTMIQNIGLLSFPFLNGQLRDATHSYVWSQTMFATLGIVGFFAALLLRRADGRAGGLLERAPKSAEA